MKMNRNLVGVIAAVLLAVVGGFLVYNSTQGSESEADDELTVETETVLLVRNDIAAGTFVSDIAGDDAAESVETTQIPTETVSARAIGSLDELRVLAGEGYVFQVAVPAGGQLTTDQLILPGEQRNSAIEVDPDLFEFTVALAPERALGGRVDAGDRVALVASFEAEGETPRQTVTILENIQVTNVQTEAALTPEQQTTNPLGPSLVASGRLFITFAVDVSQMESLTYAAEYGSLWLANQNPDAVTTDSAIRDRQDVVGLEMPEDPGPTADNDRIQLDLTDEGDEGETEGN